MATTLSGKETTSGKSKARVQTLGPVRFQGLVDHLRQQITSGMLVPGDRLPSFVELQTQFGTSPGTVNRALISLEQDGLVVRERRRGVFVAERKARAKQHAIGLAGLDTKTIHSSYWVQLVEGIQAVMHREEMDLVLLRPNSTHGTERVDAVLWHGANADALPDIAHLMPTVSVMEKTEGFASVIADDFAGTREATEYLLKLGHRKIACLNFLRAPVNQQRLAGYRSAMQDAGITPHKSWIEDMEPSEGATLLDGGHLRMKKWLEGNWKKTGCTAVLCQNDTVAVGVMQALREAGLSVPEDVSVIGFDGTEEGRFCTPHLTTLEVPLRQIGAAAAEMVLQKIHGVEPADDSLKLPVKLVVRDSTAPPPC